MKQHPLTGNEEVQALSIALPAGWVRAKLGDLGEWSGGGTPSKSTPAFWQNGDIPWISPKDMKADLVGDAEDYITAAALDASATKLVPANSVLMVVRSGILRHTFPVAVSDRDVTLNQDMKALTPIHGLDPRYLFYYLRFANQRILHQCAKDGTTVQSVDFDRLKALEVAVAPASEQPRIVARIEALFEQIAEGEARLRDAHKLLGAYRQSVFKAAVTGELTADWRRTHKPAETGADQLARSLARRREVSTNSANGRGKHLEPIPPNTSDLPELPASWVWAGAEQLCHFITKGTTPRKEQMTEVGEIPFIKVYNLADTGYVDFSVDPTFVAESVARGTLSRSRTFPGDILINIVGPPLGQVAEVPDTYPEWNVNQAIAIFRPMLPEMRFYLKAYLQSPFCIGWLKARAKATAGQSNLTLEVCRALPVPLPPPAEQREIIDRLAGLGHSSSSVLRDEVAAAKLAASLRLSVLRDAFLGHLTRSNSVHRVVS